MPLLAQPHQAFDVRDGPDPGVRYESGLTICDEALVDGHWVGRYWSAVGRLEAEAEAVPELGPAREIDAPSLNDSAAFRLVVDDLDLAGG